MAINARTEEFQHIEVFDKFALFTNARIDRTTVPEGWYCYDFRGTGDDPGELRFIEESVIVNHSGSILMPEKLELPESGQLDAWDELGFLDEDDMTFREFCELHDLLYPAEDNPLIGRVTFVGDDAQEFTDVYDGQFFPCYYYEPHATTVAVTSQSAPENTAHITWLYLPMAQEEIDRALHRAGITDSANIRLRLEDTQLPNEVNVLLDMQHESLEELNELAQTTNALSTDDIKKLGAAVTLAKPQNAEQVKNLAENLDLFDFAPGAHSPAEYGKYMIQQSGHYEFDENLDEFYDYEGYAQQRMNNEDGMFTDRGYIAYKGYFSLEEIMESGQGGGMEMRGM